MYCLYVGVDYTYIDVKTLAHKFGFKPLLGLEPMATICPQLLVSHANHLATETSIYVCMYVCVCVCVCVCMCVCKDGCVCVYIYIVLVVVVLLLVLCFMSQPVFRAVA